MPCFTPNEAFRPEDGGPLIFTGRNYVSHDDHRYSNWRGAPIRIQCHQCLGCRLERSRQWAMRCMHESSLYQNNCFITLTYSNENLPAVGSLVPRDFQLFMKRVRKRFGSGVRFYGCGEYGDEFGRPHYHALLFNMDFHDKKPWRKPGEHQLYRSERLEALWPLGASEIGSVSFDSAAYVARYCVKKFTGKSAAEHYHRVDAEGRSHMIYPEFGRMSLRPGIGKPWLDKFHADVYNYDFCLVNGVKVSPPVFYDRKYAESNPTDFEMVSLGRMKGLDFRGLRRDNTPARSAVKAEIVEARYEQTIRSL